MLALAGFLLVTAVTLVRVGLLDDETLLRALDTGNAYQRIHSEVLPQVLVGSERADLQEWIMDELAPDGSGAVPAEVVSARALRIAVPPSALRSGTRTALPEVLGYVRGDGDRPDAELDLSDVLDRADDVAEIEVRSLLARVAAAPVSSPAEYRADLARFAADLRSGRVPATVPVLDGALLPEPAVDEIVEQFDDVADRGARDRLRLALSAGEAREVLLIVGAAEVGAATRQVVEQLRGDALATGRERSGGRDVVTLLGGPDGPAPSGIAGSVETARRVVRWFGPATAVGGGVLILLGSALIVRGGRREVLTAVRRLSVTAVVVGLGVAVGWFSGTRLAGSRLPPPPGPGGLPSSLRELLVDVEAALLADLDRLVTLLVGVPVAAGSLGLAVSAVMSRRLRVPVRVLVVVAAVTVVAAGASLLVPWRSPAAAHPCNGHVELCDRRYDEVTQAGAHAAASGHGPVSIWPEQDADLRAQLDLGIHVLLLDSRRWTALTSADQLVAARPGLSRQVAERVVAAVGPSPAGRAGSYLCHDHCALGAVPLVDALREIRGFLDASPHEVVTLVLSDRTTGADRLTGEELGTAFAAAGLTPYLHAQPPGVRWPTLGDLIASGRRLVVFTEPGGQPQAWLHRAADHLRRTPDLPLTSEDLDCRPREGAPGTGLLLVNHRVRRAAPDRNDAATVNARDTVVETARWCERELGEAPDVVAADFVTLGDLVEAVDVLNGVGGDVAPRRPPPAATVAGDPGGEHRQ